MALYKQKGSDNWWISVYRPGAPRLRKSTGTPDLNAAKAIEATFRMAMCGNIERERLIAALDAVMGFQCVETGIPVDQIEDAYRKLPDHRESANTIQTRCAHVREMSAWMQRHWPTARFMHQISREAAIAYADHLRTVCKTGKTFNNTRGNLVRVFNLLLVRGQCRENVWTLTQTANLTDSKSGRAFTAEEMERLYAQAKAAGNDWFPLVVLGRYTGLRYGDIANLRSSDIRDGIIYLRPAKTARKNIRVAIPLHPRAASVIPKRDGNLFPDHAFSDYSDRPQKKAFSTILQDAKIKPKGAKLSFHCLRHTFRTELAKAGVPEEIAMRLGGWTESDTSALYNHDIGQLKKAISSLA
jgi:integrase